jgi:DNA-binding CsgD family transcriptional regulator
MASGLRHTGVKVLGDVPWGTHVCLFYETKQDLLDVLVPFFVAGLENREACLWVVAEPLTEAEAEAALRDSVPKFDAHVSAGSIEIRSGSEWYLGPTGRLDVERAIEGLQDRVNSAAARQCEGLRASGNAFWPDGAPAVRFDQYEAELGAALQGRSMLILCTYSLLKSRAVDVFDVARAHDLTIARRNGAWQFIEAAEHQARGPTLTRREREVIGWVAQGKTAWEIGGILKIAKRTVDEHTHSAMKKLGAANRAQAVALALRSRLIEI